jgi:predicted Ser/Thr protein kinase
VRGRGAAVMLAALLAASSARAEEWFDAYSRGLEALKQKQGPKAAQLFERAIRLRPEPGTNLITYGTNRLDRYHPYLRLAEAYLLNGEPEKAKEALTRSEARGKEPADERSRLAVLASDAAARARAAAATPPPVAATPPPPTTLAQASAPPPPTTLAAAAPPPPPTLAAAAPPPISRPTGTLDLRSDPPGATALMDGRLLGTTPLRVDVDAGLHQVTLRREGSADLTFATRIDTGKTVSEKRALVATTPIPSSAPPMPAEASLVVYSDPPGATVYLDDEPMGATDAGTGRLAKTGLAPGAHRVRLSLPGRIDFAQEARLAPGGPTTIRGTLAVPAPSGLDPRLVALGGGLVVLLIVAGLVVRRRPAAEAQSTVALPPRSAATGRGRTVTATPRTPGTGRTISPSPTEVPIVTLSSGLDLETRAMNAATTPSAANKAFGEYRLEEQLGKGGMATVFKAERRGERCALKRPLTAFLEDPEFLERFLREAEIGRTLHHPNIIRIFERGDVGGVPYFTMELIEGETLQALVKRNGAITPRKAAGIVAQVAEALDYAHLKGVVHRDLKPSNIMILRDGIVKVMDYGIARARRFEGLTVTGAFLGTPDYVAPETAEGKGSDARSDLYSLGIVFYEMLTGKKPFVGDTPFATLKKHCTEAPTPPSALSPEVPRELEEIVLRLMSKDPAERYPGAEELLIALRSYLNRAA